ncbi:unnamed protein product [Orchesella dallaii]|uniref:MYND-type domain-containing protein n=1 Tax=Orchesella dallaii TaxID=48710 RepID=A0ABP1QMC5_9HEXA
MDKIAMEGASSGVEIELSKLTAESELLAMTNSTATEQRLLQEEEAMVAELAIEGQEHVFLAHKFSVGCTVTQDANEAFRLYKLGAEAGNAEAIFYYALCYATGKGVEKDYAMAYQIHLQAASLSPDFPGRKNLALKNYGVAQAQNAIGYMYENKVGLEQDFVLASIWYKRASDNGSGDGANNLGNLYFRGLGVPQNKRMAAYFWLRAVKLNVPEAANSIMLYYLSAMEPERAKEMFIIGKKLGNAKFSIRKTDEEFEQLYSSVKSKRDGLVEAISAFEKEHDFPISGMSFLDRVQREVSANTPEIINIFEKMYGKCSIKDFGVGFNNKYEVDLNLLKSKALGGSALAIEVLKTIVNADELVQLLEKDPLTEKDKLQSVQLFYDCSIMEVNTILFPPKAMKKLEKIVEKLFRQNKLADNSEMAMKTTFCHLALNFRPGKNVYYGIDLVLEALKRYPLNFAYYDLLSSLYGRVGDHAAGLYIVTKALEKFPENANLLFSRAIHLHLLKPVVEMDRKVVIEAYRQFLLKAPEDHRKYPDAYYAMATLSTDSMEINHYFNLGLEAETKILPCYLPYVSSKCKDIAKTEVQLCDIDKKAEELAISVNENEMKLTLLERKPYLNNPVRKELVISHRQANYDNRKMMETEGPNVSIQFGPSHVPKLIQKFSRRGRPRSITLGEMKTTKDDKIYKDRLIQLVIIEDPNFNSHSIEVIAEDENRDVTRLLVYNVGKTKEEIEKLGFGSKISIFNPYLSVEGEDSWIRNDDPKCIEFLGKKNKLCRFCGEEKACSACSKCKRAGYCSKDCQTFDVKKMKHKLICFPE